MTLTFKVSTDVSLPRIVHYLLNLNNLCAVFYSDINKQKCSYTSFSSAIAMYKLYCIHEAINFK